MDNLFLPRESDSTETGPQIFTKNDGAEPVDFIFASLGALFDSSSSSSSSEESSSSSSEESSSSSSSSSSEGTVIEQTFNVTNSGSSAYIIDGLSNPTLTLTRGLTYEFLINALNHPFWIKTSATTGTGDTYNEGVVNNGITDGTITFTVPLDAPNTLFYICQFHSSMGGTINIVGSSSSSSSSSLSEESSSSSSEESSSSSSEESSSSSSEDGPGLFNSVLVENAGLSVLNGIYVYVTEFEGKPYYYKPENPSLFILWFEGMWEIYDFDLDGLPIYIGNEDVLYPWNVTVWQSPNPIYEPVPTVTKVL
jgi:hypothetical protein